MPLFRFQGTSLVDLSPLRAKRFQARFELVSMQVWCVFDGNVGRDRRRDPRGAAGFVALRPMRYAAILSLRHDSTVAATRLSSDELGRGRAVGRVLRIGAKPAGGAANRICRYDTNLRFGRRRTLGLGSLVVRPHGLRARGANSYNHRQSSAIAADCRQWPVRRLR